MYARRINMDIGLIATWTFLGLTGIAFAPAGLMKLGKRNAKMLERTPWMEDFSEPQVRLIGTAEILGAIGLVVPFATGILPWLSPIAGAGLVVLMLGAAATHIRRKEHKMVPVNLTLAVLAGAAAYLTYVRL